MLLVHQLSKSFYFIKRKIKSKFTFNSVPRLYLNSKDTNKVQIFNKKTNNNYKQTHSNRHKKSPENKALRWFNMFLLFVYFVALTFQYKK
jgi:hypothetical protein